MFASYRRWTSLIPALPVTRQGGETNDWKEGTAPWGRVTWCLLVQCELTCVFSYHVNVLSKPVVLDYVRI